MDNDQFSAEETERRLEKTLEGAFSGPPTLLKDIPTRQGKQRVKRKPQEPRRRPVAQHFLAVGNCASGGPRAPSPRCRRVRSCREPRPSSEDGYGKSKLTIYNTLSGVSTISHKLLAPIASANERAFFQSASVLSASDQRARLDREIV